jgi:hypothetical protein
MPRIQQRWLPTGQPAVVQPKNGALLHRRSRARSCSLRLCAPPQALTILGLMRCYLPRAHGRCSPLIAPLANRPWYNQHGALLHRPVARSLVQLALVRTTASLDDTGTDALLPAPCTRPPLAANCPTGQPAVVQPQTARYCIARSRARSCGLALVRTAAGLEDTGTGALSTCPVHTAAARR